jgi:hypothetical protein
MLVNCKFKLSDINIIKIPLPAVRLNDSVTSARNTSTFRQTHQR